ncbi:MAG: cardiolipin synthase ClsB [Candidatus Dactylopiibacterium sp.]|nr:cardiolipin synthase ClsB [Candidatus Dactylopiibacterium sp.]
MKSRPLGGNQIDLLRDGTEYFPALVEAIAAARREVLLETYIFESDATGLAVMQALRDAAARGVIVRVLVDGFGAAQFVTRWVEPLGRDGVEVQVFRRELRLFALRRHRLRRMHRKLALVDGEVAFVGGINVIDDVDARAPAPPRFDFAVRVRGPLVMRIHAAMARLWRLVSWASLRRRPVFQNWVTPARRRVGDMRAEFLVRDNLRHRRDIETAYVAAIRRAREDILIANAYFFPGRAFSRALTDAAARGVRVRVLLQGKVEYWLQYHACRVLYPHLVRDGVEVIEYRKSFLHAKVAVIDGTWATVGSSNIDPFSLLLAREANVVVHDAGFTATLREALEHAIAEGGVELTADHWVRLGWWQRLIDWAAYGFVRVMMGVAGLTRAAD